VGVNIIAKLIRNFTCDFPNYSFMAGIYIHVPFCKRICSYCDFYKTAVISLIPDFLKTLEKELEINNQYLQNEIIETIYFGGGSPSLLKPEQILHILEKIQRLYRISEDCEVTLEANPDDLSFTYLKSLTMDTPVNRLSIGIQSFNDSDLLLLNRRHTATQALSCIEEARLAGFRNISIDLIYGLPGMKTPEWQKNLNIAFSLEIEHLSAYHLSIEPGTALSRKASHGLLNLADEEESTNQFVSLSMIAGENKFIHYEISNLAREGYFSRHNSNYWLQKKYLGAGPSAHSYDLNSRQWNFSPLKKYIHAIDSGEIFFEREELNIKTRYNEYLMVSLRTMMGVDLEKLIREFGEKLYKGFQKAIQPNISSGHMIWEGSSCRMTMKGWLISDYIISRLIGEEE
jgi:oxygen-independent coproporphyrinogen-3 oxidase